LLAKVVMEMTSLNISVRFPELIFKLNATKLGGMALFTYPLELSASALVANTGMTGLYAASEKAADVKETNVVDWFTAMNEVLMKNSSAAEGTTVTCIWNVPATKAITVPLVNVRLKPVPVRVVCRVIAVGTQAVDSGSLKPRVMVSVLLSNDMKLRTMGDTVSFV